MEKLLFDALIDCYENSTSAVQIMDMEWNVLWSNRPELMIDNLPERLGIVPDDCTNSSHIFIWERCTYRCRLLCNVKHGYRVAEFCPELDESQNLRLDVDSIAHSVLSMTMLCGELNAEFEENDLYDQKGILNHMIGNCYRLYRMAFLQQEIDRLSSARRKSECFLVNMHMNTIYERIRSILRSCAQIQYSVCPEEVYLEGDPDEFIMAVLSALVLCYRPNRCFQNIDLSLRSNEQTASVQVSITRTEEELPPSKQGMNMIETSNDDGERAILNSFCQHFNGSWMIAEQKKTNSISCTITFRSLPKSRNSSILFSQRNEKESRFYNKYEILLSRIYFRNMF